MTLYDLQGPGLDAELDMRFGDKSAEQEKITRARRRAGVDAGDLVVGITSDRMPIVSAHREVDASGQLVGEKLNLGAIMVRGSTESGS